MCAPRAWQNAVIHVGSYRGKDKCPIVSICLGARPRVLYLLCVPTQTAPAAADRLSRAGFVAPCQFAGFRDVMTDDDGNTPEDPECVACALCGRGLRYVVSFTDANGARFDIGKECSKWLRLSPAEKKAAAAASREARALAAAERAEPGYIARKIADAAAREAAALARNAAQLAAFVAERETAAAKLAGLDTPKCKAAAAAADFLDLWVESVAAAAAKVAQLDGIIAHIAART